MAEVLATALCEAGILQRLHIANLTHIFLTEIKINVLCTWIIPSEQVYLTHKGFILYVLEIFFSTLWTSVVSPL